MRFHVNMIRLSFALVTILMMSPRIAAGANITFQKIVETGKNIPGLSVPVNKLMFYPTIDGSKVVFGVATPKTRARSPR